MWMFASFMCILGALQNCLIQNYIIVYPYMAIVCETNKNSKNSYN